MVAAAAGDGEAIVCLLMPERKTTLTAGSAAAAAAAVAEPPGTTTAVSVTTAAVPGSSSTAAGATGTSLPVAVDSQSSAAKFLLIEVRECIPMGGEEWERERAPYDRGVSAYATLLEGKLWRHGCGGRCMDVGGRETACDLSWSCSPGHGVHYRNLVPVEESESVAWNSIGMYLL